MGEHNTVPDSASGVHTAGTVGSQLLLPHSGL